MKNTTEEPMPYVEMHLPHITTSQNHDDRSMRCMTIMRICDWCGVDVKANPTEQFIVPTSVTRAYCSIRSFTGEYICQ